MQRERSTQYCTVSICNSGHSDEAKANAGGGKKEKRDACERAVNDDLEQCEDIMSTLFLNGRYY